MKMLLKFVCVTTCVLALGACASSVTRLERSDVKPLSEHAIVGGRHCRMPRFDLIDARSRPGLARSDAGEVTFPDLLPWLKEAIEAATVADPDAARLSIELRHAYIEHHETGSYFQFVLRAHSDQAPQWRNYRASSGSVGGYLGAKQLGAQVHSAAGKSLRSLVAQEGNCAS